MGTKNVVVEKSFDLAVRIVRLYQFLCNEKKEFVLSKQLLRSGTSVGANVSEAIQGQSRKDFLSKMSISLKEAAETEYWLELLFRTDYLDEKQYASMMKDCEEVKSLLHAIVKTTGERMGSN